MLKAAIPHGSDALKAQWLRPLLAPVLCVVVLAVGAYAQDDADTGMAAPVTDTVAAPGGGGGQASEDSLLRMLGDVDADLDELRKIETSVYQYADDESDSGLSDEILQGRIENLRDYEIQMLNMLGFTSGSLDMQITQIQENIDGLEREKRILIEQLIKEKIKINKELPFLEREVVTTSRMQMEKYEQYLERFPNSEFADNIYFRLADYYYAEAGEQYEKALERYDEDYDDFARAESLYNAGLLPDLPEMPAFPQKDFSKPRAMCQRIIDQYPDSDVRDDAFFNIGYFFEEEMKRERALPYYQQLVNDFPESRYVPEALLRIGEYYFDNPDADSGTGLERAVEAYKKIMPFWMHPNFALAIYKLGWTYYRLFDYANAISYFIFLLDDSRAVKEAEVPSLKTAYNLDKEALRYVAMSFKENVSEEQLFSPEPWAGVPEKTKGFVEKLGDKPYAPAILEELGNIYREVDQSIGAIQSYQALLDLYPQFSRAYEIQQKIVDMYDAMTTDPEIAKKYGKDWAVEHANDARLSLFRNYGKAWADTIQDAGKREKVVKMAKDAVYYVAAYHFEQAQKSKDPEEYDRAIELFREYLSDFPDGEQAYEIRWIIAHILDTELKRMDEAFNEYFRVSRDRNFDKHREEAATNAIALTQDMIKVEAARLVGDSVALKEVSGAERKYMAAIDNFISLLPEHADVPVMLYNKASLFYNKDKYDEAEAVYEELIRRYPKRRESVEALKLIATAYSKRGRYETAIDWYSRWRDMSEKSEDRQLANDLIAQSLRDIALRYQKDGNHLKAAQAFERVVAEQPNYKFAPQTLFDAAKEYEAVEDYRKAAVIYQQIVMNYPGEKDAPAALWNASLAYDKNGDKRQAAQLYEQLAKIYPTYENVSAAIYNAAIKYEELEDWRNAARVFEWFVQEYPDDKENREFLFTAGKYYNKVGDERKSKEVYATFSERFPDDVRVIEIKYDLAMTFYKKKQMDDAKAGMYEVIAAFDAAGSPADFRGRAAEASFIIAELEYKDYAAIEFKLPKSDLDRSFDRKLKMLSDLNDKYAKVVQYGIINWAPQSVYKIARNYEEFANTYANQEVPEFADPDAEVEALKKIKLNLTSMLEKAIDPYQTTIDLAANLKGVPSDTMIAPWIVKAKLKKIETVYRIAIAKKQAQMMELNRLATDTSATAWVKNMKTYNRVAKRLTKIVPDFERVFAVAQELGTDVQNPGMVGQEDVSVSMDEMMRVMLSPEEQSRLEEAAAAQDDAARKTVDADTARTADSLAAVLPDSAAAGSLAAAVPDTGLTDTLAAAVDSSVTDTGIAVADSASGVPADTAATATADTAADTAKARFTVDLDVSGAPEIIAIVNNSKVELSHLLYLAGDLTGKGALEFLSAPVPEQVSANPMLLTEYKKQIAQAGVKYIKPGIESFSQGLLTAADYNIQSQWVDQSKTDLIRNANIGPQLFSELSLASLGNFREYSALYRRLYETGEATEDGQDAYGIEGLMYQFSDYGVLFAKVAMQTYQTTLDLALENQIGPAFMRGTHTALAKFVFQIGSGYEKASANSRRTATLYSDYATGDTANVDSFALNLDPVVAEDLTYVYQENADIFYDNCIELYEIGYEMLQTSGIKNDWVMKVQERLAALLPDIYGEPEKLDFYSEHIVSGPQVRAYGHPDSMWTGTYYADTAWHNAVPAPFPGTVGSIAGFDSSSAVPVWSADSTDTVRFRKVFRIPGIPKKAAIVITAADNYRLFANEVYIAKDDTMPGDWSESATYDIVDYLYEGDNLLSIQANRNDSAAYGLVFDLYVRYGVKPGTAVDQQPADVSVSDAADTASTGVRSDTVFSSDSTAVPDSAAADTGSVTVPSDSTASAGTDTTAAAAPVPGSDSDPVCIEREELAKTNIEIESLKIESFRTEIGKLDRAMERLQREIDSLSTVPADAQPPADSTVTEPVPEEEAP